METNQNPVQELPAQLIAPNFTLPARPFYNPAELARIVEILTKDDYFDPEYILLFGKLAGGTPHSDTTAYDLLVVVRETPAYNWIQAKRTLRYKVPIKRREIVYINLYIMTRSHVETTHTPFLHFAHAEGQLLYCNDHFLFRRPKRPFDFARACANARLHYDTFRTLGNDLIEQAQDAFRDGSRRLAALFAAQAVIYFYHTLYFVYHGEEFDIHDPVIMHERMRTLSMKLILALDDCHIENIFTLPCLKKFLNTARYDLDFDIPPQEMEVHLDRVSRMAHIVEQCAGLRLELYERLSIQQ